MNFKRYITEKKAKKSAEAPEETTAVMAFGRFNPPTVGHEKLIQKVGEVAREHGGEAHIIASHSQGTQKDPLPQDKKLQYLNAIAPGSVKVSGSSKEEPTIFHAAAKLHAAGHSHLVIVAGSDRVDEYQKVLDKYNGVKGKHGFYKFKSIKVVSAGQRDPDAEGVEGMSGTKMRDLARSGDLARFKMGLPESLHPHAEEIMNHIQGLKTEDYENPYRFDWGTPEGTDYMKKMTPKMKTECGVGEVWSKEKGMCVSIREEYNINDLVETADGKQGKVVYRGATYVTIQLENGNTKKYWTKDIQPIQENAPLPEKPIIRNRMSSSQIPVLLMSKKQIEEKLAPAKISYKELKEMYKQRDINFNPSKEVNMGIDKTIEGQTADGKPLGMVSFKTFIQGEVAKVAKEYNDSTNSIKQAQLDIDAAGHHMHHPQVKLRMTAED